MTSDIKPTFSVKLAIFAKPPEDYKVKTRLIPAIGASNATDVYRICLHHGLCIAEQSGLDHCCYLTELSTDPIFGSLKQNQQCSGNLGDKLYQAFSEMLSSTDAAIIIGTDCLDMTTAHLQGAAAALQSHDLVLQPVEDGGYSLIGCRRIDAALFANVNWSTATVLKKTMENAEAIGYRLTQLETVRDIDTADDLAHYEAFKTILNAQAEKN